MKKFLSAFLLSFFWLLHAFASGPSGTLPVIYINIEDGAEVVTKEPYLNAVYWLEPNGAEGVEALGSSSEPLALKIKGRGNYTFTGFDKKPYRLKLDKKAALCGMKKSKHFGLLAHADDNQGFLRNAVGFKVAQMVGLPWTPDMAPVEVVVNGTYRGLYFATELIRIDKDRVNIQAWEEEDADGNPLSKWVEGGTLVELDNYDEEAQIKIDNPNAPEPMRITYDKSVDPGFEPAGYVDWLKSSFASLNDLILNGDRDSNELWAKVDIDDLARYILVQEYLDNYESFHGSCYMHRDFGENQKWHFSPVWDFGSAFQRLHPDHSFHLTASGNPHYNYWAAELLEFPALREKIKEYWLELRDKRAELDAFADSYINSITAAAACDKERWPQYGNDNLRDKLSFVKQCLDHSTKFINKEYAGSSTGDYPEVYLIGEFNGWSNADEAYHFEHIGNGLYMYHSLNGVSGEWKLNNGCWNSTVDFGAASEMPVLEKTCPVAFMGPNISTSIPAGYYVYFDYKGQEGSTIRITSNMSALETPISDAVTVSVEGDALIITASESCSVNIADVTGRSTNISLPSGTSRFRPGRGIWILNGRKYVL